MDGNCDFVGPALPTQIQVSTGVSNVAAFNGGSVPEILLRTITFAPGQHMFVVSFQIQAECISLLAPIWSLKGQVKCCNGECIPVHTSVVAAVDCIPEEVYSP